MTDTFPPLVASTKQKFPAALKKVERDNKNTSWTVTTLKSPKNGMQINPPISSAKKLQKHMPITGTESERYRVVKSLQARKKVLNTASKINGLKVSLVGCKTSKTPMNPARIKIQF